ncbi:hypothetical protein HDK90DRAFT_514883 [Phyllosticta capitalensis]|uniref:Uncharacterized protein n=1 Tax=Phyllosticta capitalensis TaxID=121624 RepID=A0ABR1YBA8_9PEZI
MHHFAGWPPGFSQQQFVYVQHGQANWDMMGYANRSYPSSVDSFENQVMQQNSAAFGRHVSTYDPRLYEYQQRFAQQYEWCFYGPSVPYPGGAHFDHYHPMPRQVHHGPYGTIQRGWSPVAEGTFSMHANRMMYSPMLQHGHQAGDPLPGPTRMRKGNQHGGSRQARAHNTGLPPPWALAPVSMKQQLGSGRKAEPPPRPGMICYLHKDIDSRVLKSQVRSKKDYGEILGHPVVILQLPASPGETYFAKVTTFGGKSAEEKCAGCDDKTTRRFQREYFPIAHGKNQEEGVYELQVKNGKKMGAKSWVNIGPKNILRIETRHLPPFRRTTKQGTEYELTPDSLQVLMSHFFNLASSSPTLGPSLSLRFGCCATQNATPTPQEKPQGKPLLRLRSDSTPGPEIQVKRTRSHKRDFAATQSPGVFDDAEERYWSRRGAIDRSKSSASPLNSPIEKPQRNHNSWLVPGRIAFLPQVRKGSILADQVLPKFQAQLAKHPVVVMSTPNSRGVVAIAILTSLGGQTVQEKYARMYAENPDRARMFGGDYLLIKHRSTPLHDNTPLLRLKDGKEMARRTYVSAAYGNFYVQAEDLAPYRENGFGKDSELFLDETSFKDLTALFNFQSLLLVILLLVCTSTYLHAVAPGLLDRNKDGVFGIFWKFARVGERLSPLHTDSAYEQASLFMGS